MSKGLANESKITEEQHIRSIEVCLAYKSLVLRILYRGLMVWVIKLDQTFWSRGKRFPLKTTPLYHSMEFELVCFAYGFLSNEKTRRLAFFFLSFFFFFFPLLSSGIHKGMFICFGFPKCHHTCVLFMSCHSSEK